MMERSSTAVCVLGSCWTPLCLPLPLTASSAVVFAAAVQASIAANTYVVSGPSTTKSIAGGQYSRQQRKHKPCNSSGTEPSSSAARSPPQGCSNSSNLLTASQHGRVCSEATVAAALLGDFVHVVWAVAAMQHGSNSSSRSRSGPAPGTREQVPGDFRAFCVCVRCVDHIA